MDLDDPRPEVGDAFGAALVAHHESRSTGGAWHVDREAGWHVVERDDGHVDALPATPYFAEPEQWQWDLERAALESATGRVLDVGVGAGRFCLALAERGLDAVGLDPSPGAIEVSRERGVHGLHLGTVFDLEDPRPFDTFLLMGNNVGLLESADHCPRFLGALRRMAGPGARILGIGLDPSKTDNPRHLAYQERNRRRGRLPGQLRLRIRFQHLATTWWDYLLVRPSDLRSLVEGTGWAVVDIEREGPLYLATLATR